MKDAELTFMEKDLICSKNFPLFIEWLSDQSIVKEIDYMITLVD